MRNHEGSYISKSFFIYIFSPEWRIILLLEVKFFASVSERRYQKKMDI